MKAIGPGSQCLQHLESVTAIAAGVFVEGHLLEVLFGDLPPQQLVLKGHAYLGGC